MQSKSEAETGNRVCGTASAGRRVEDRKIIEFTENWNLRLKRPERLQALLPARCSRSGLAHTQSKLFDEAKRPGSFSAALV